MSTGSFASRHGPGAQAVRAAFWFIAVVAALAALAWACSNVQRVPPDSQAVVMRFGKFVRHQSAGLLIAWPRPFETVVLLPGPARVLVQPIAELDRDARARALDPAPADTTTPSSDRSTGSVHPGDATSANGPLLSDALAGSGYVLTGDAAVVQLAATLYYRVSSPYDYVVQQPLLSSALERLTASAVAEVGASRDLDAILVARPELLAADARMAAQRERLRDDIARAVERRLQALEARHAGLGIEVSRVDVQANLPAAAVDAFNSVLSSLQTAERNIADARTAAETTRQAARQHADQILQNAQASVTERVTTAQAETQTILQLEAPLDANSDPGLLARAYRDRVAQILSKAGRVTTIDPYDTSSLVLPGRAQ
ncbi:Regulator of protease activity HflC, stomatin/prohibitin superfamily [Paraburkholderia caballeronis]|uniref:Regulator of protease activity HflC, stomatin/prohibitin superfamily n=1 Tax=Paraburkholderia caballeronis TaxID=416943 RepID=A0A1H7F2Q7_9BURK|nr:regulator of protease activity HflC (stomatin/prohibitin superfamily) [Paraburkholderia caballeronis]PXW99706.1 regulator of protease activity HflC (stomatin/prohibitin superfamily) [Paraburkholderia caballeronis]RAJ96660.1 regulator of protease activity HflC (stomatin/prohibitin superfamily) [Paraburkholderia caballeronis]SEE77826.1 Regulator of protease activity HflC, stomatin/prohibitin superfamily [Paraburkholderia caballeronis]SEK20403.1 Regulator of protease activity HflC, stomatin/pro